MTNRAWVESEALWGGFLEEVTFKLGPAGCMGVFQGLTRTENLNLMSTDLEVGKGLHQPRN